MTENWRFHPALTVTNIKKPIPITLGMEKVQYSAWTELFKVHCRACQVLDHIITPDEKPGNVDEGVWSRLDAVVLQWIYRTISNDLLLTIIAPNTTAKQAWDRLHSIFQDNNNSRALHLESHFTRVRLDNNNTRALHLENLFSRVQLDHFPNDISAYCQELKMIADGLSGLGDPVSNQRLVLRLIAGLNEDYDVVTTIILQSDPLPQFYDACSKLIFEETRKAKETAANASASNDAVQSETGQKRDYKGKNHGGRGRGGNNQQQQQHAPPPSTWQQQQPSSTWQQQQPSSTWQQQQHAPPPSVWQQQQQHAPPPSTWQQQRAPPPSTWQQQQQYHPWEVPCLPWRSWAPQPPSWDASAPCLYPTTTLVRPQQPAPQPASSCPYPTSTPVPPQQPAPQPASPWAYPASTSVQPQQPAPQPASSCPYPTSTPVQPQQPASPWPYLTSTSVRPPQPAPQPTSTLVRPPQPAPQQGILGARPAPAQAYSALASPPRQYAPTDINVAMQKTTLNAPDANTGATSHVHITTLNAHDANTGATSHVHITTLNAPDANTGSTSHMHKRTPNAPDANTEATSHVHKMTLNTPDANTQATSNMMTSKDEDASTTKEK